MPGDRELAEYPSGVCFFYKTLHGLMHLRAIRALEIRIFDDRELCVGIAAHMVGRCDLGGRQERNLDGVYGVGILEPDEQDEIGKDADSQQHNEEFLRE